MAEQSKYTPIEGLVTPKVRVDLPLPSYIDQSQIGLHLGRVRTLCRMGGIGHLRITGHTGDETSSAMPVMIGFNSQGGGYAGKLGTRVDIPTYRSNHSPLETILDVPHSARWIDGVISANIDEITQRIRQDKESNIRSQQAWANQLDNVLRAGIRDIGTNYLMRGLAEYDYDSLTSFIIGNLLYEIGNPLGIMRGQGIKLPIGPGLLQGMIITSMLLNIVNYIKYHPKYNSDIEEGSRFSLFYSSPQVDRAMILQFLSARKNIIKVLDN